MIHVLLLLPNLLFLPLIIINFLKLSGKHGFLLSDLLLIQSAFDLSAPVLHIILIFQGYATLTETILK